MKYVFTHSDKATGNRINTKATNKLFLWIPALVLLFSMFSGKTEAQVCCPEFKLKDAVEICPPEGACKSGGTAVGQGHSMAACKLTIHEYTVYPIVAGFTYSWTIIGGSPATFTGNPINVLWGSGATGIIKVLMSNAGIGGFCRDSISQEICLIDGPKANFTLSSDTVCTNSPVQFTNTSLGGSSYLWDFGDGNTSTLANPPVHSYALPGTYTVTLTATNAGTPSQSPDMRPPCGCIDKISKTVTVISGAGPTIDVTCCYGTVCAGDTSSFCTSAVCSTYTWTVSGGTIISGLGTNCIKVKWNNTYSGPTTVSLAVPGCATAPCAGTTTLNVPVLYPNLPINGPTTLCVGASGSYFLPTLPGTYYLWTTNAPPGFFSFNDKNKNTPNVNISFTLPGTYQLQCQYQNPMAGCNGVSVITINVLPVFSIQGDETVCQGDTIIYYANGMATWSASPAGAIVPPGPSTTSNIIWNVPGNFTIKAVSTTPGVFCNDTAYKVVKVVAKPILGIISGPVLVCPGKNFTYSITSNTQDSPFVWSVTGGGAVMSEIGADRDSAIIKLTGLGPWTIKVFQKIEISPGNFCKSLTKTLTVTRYTAPVISGNGSVCVDAIETYVASGPVPPGGIQWTISPAYQGSIVSQTGNSVNIHWHGTPNTAIITASHCGGSGTKSVTIINPPFVAPISSSGPLGYCLPNMPNNITLSTTSGFPSYQWFLNNSPIFGANAFTYNVPNGTFTGQGTYYFSVAVSNGSCTIYKTTYFYIDTCAGGGGGTPTNPVPCTIDFTINPNPACENQPITFTAVPSNAGFTFAWDFGDNSTSFVSPTQHTYTIAGTDTVTLVATIGNCVVVKKKVVTVNPTPTCIITSSDTSFCPGGFVTLYACTGMTSYQWYRDGSLIPGANGNTYNASKHGEYEVEVSNSFGCLNRSNNIYIYKKAPPIAKVTGDGLVCAFPNSFNSFQLSAYSEPAYVYNWSSNAGGATFTPNNSNASNITTVGLALPAVLPVTYYFVVEVTDTVTTCVSRDTLCVTFFETPSFNFPYNAGCQGNPMTFTPSLIDTLNYKYHWSSGQTTPVITVTAPGSYALTITDKISGCSATANAGVIYPKPDLSLFPDGCDTIFCKTDTLRMYIPLPLSFNPPFNTYPNAYPLIEWFDNGNYGTPIAIGQNFNFVAATSGSHQISVVVTTNHGCTDTTGVFCLTVLCGDIQFNCPTGPIILPCNSPNPTIADALATVGSITDSCPGPININVTGGIAAPISGCWWKSVFTIIASNGCGQADTCILTYQWKKDTEPPVFAHCPSGPITLPCNATHPTNADALAAAGNITDNCPGTINPLITGGVATPLAGCDWTATFTITATDSCNNSSICTIIYNWKEDTTPPQFTHCPTGPIILPCNGPLPVEDEPLLEVGPVTDNCPGPVSVVMSGGTPVPAGGCNWTATYIITATDACGNKNICYVTYNWKEDHIAPVFAHCPAGPINLPCNSPRPKEADALATVGTITDNCPGNLTIVVNGGLPTQTTGCNWTSTFSITATDSCGNSASCVITYNWKEDLVPPQFAHCPQGPVNLPCNVKPLIGELLYDIGPITDNCPGHIDVQVTGGIPTPTTGCNWTATYTITATDSCGNVNVCSVTYNWKEDQVPPTIAHCPARPISLPCNSPRPTEADAFAAAGAITDNCPGVIIQLSGGVPTPITGCNWTATFSITATDSCGNSASCVITFNWKEDLVPPQFAHCPQGPVNLPCNVKPLIGELLYDIGPITDNCPGHIDVQVTGGIPTPTTGCNWTATYTITATDSCGNVNVCSATYNWKEDQVPPTIAHCPARPISLPCNSPRPTEADAFAAAGAITDNCPGVIIQLSGGVPTPITGCNWTATFSITATDSCGNSTTCNITYNWTEDIIPPQFAHCPQGPVNLPCNVKPLIGELLYDIGPITDNCPGHIDVQVTGGIPTPTTGCNWTATYTITATDSCGNVNVCSVTYNWKEDTIAPVFANCPTEPVLLPCNSPRPTEAQAIAMVGTISDGCSGILNTAVSGGTPIPSQDCSWASTFNISVTDSCGNTTNCSITFNWKEDRIPPRYAHCPVRPITLPCNSPRPTTVNAIAAAGPVTDNCYVDFLQVTDGGVIPTTSCWFTQTFTLTATDGCGNVATCRVTYRWKEDTMAPTFAHCPTGPIELPCNSSRPTLPGALGAAGSVTDNCPGNVFVVYCLPPNDGHYDSPTATNYNTDLVVRNFVQANFTDCFPPPTTIGQMDIHTFSSMASFDLSQDGGNTWIPVSAPAQTTVRITKVDENETEQFFETEMLALNISGGTLPEGILIRESPTRVSMGETRIQSQSGEFQVDSFFDVFTEISSNAGQSWIAAPNPWNINLSGPIIVLVAGGPITPTTGCGLTQTFTITAKDGCGNISACNVVYNWKEDHIPPVYAHCPDGAITLPCNAPHPITNDAIDAAGPVTDNCYVDNIQVTDGGVIALAGCWFTETFTLTATDGCGNVTVCHVTYRWQEDHIRPTFTRPDDITIYVDNNGNFNASVSVTGDVANEDDNCSTGLNATYTDEVFSGIRPVWKIIKRTWVLADNCGNLADAQVQTITVMDLTDGKTLTISVLLEGLYNGAGTMRKAQDEFGDHFQADTADLITVELHKASDYSVIEYVSASVKLNTMGTAVVIIPSPYNVSYYLTIKHRNSIETTSANPVIFSGTSVSYAFDTPAKAYQSNLGLMIDGMAVIYAADENQDRIVDGGDLSDIGNQNDMFSVGYLKEDVNGDGLVDGSDLAITENNNYVFIMAKTP